MDITNCVGVHVRGTDMKHTPGHFVPTDASKVIRYIRGICKCRIIKKFLFVPMKVRLLSKCKALIHGRSNVAYAAIVMNDNKYEWHKCI